MKLYGYIVGPLVIDFAPVVVNLLVKLNQLHGTLQNAMTVILRNLKRHLRDVKPICIVLDEGTELCVHYENP